MIQPFWRYILTSNSRCPSLLIPDPAPRISFSHRLVYVDDVYNQYCSKFPYLCVGELELRQLAAGQVPGELGALLPGVAVVRLVLVDEVGVLGALARQVGHLGRHAARVPLHSAV